MTITRFPKTQLYDADRQIVTFAAYVGEETIGCSISLEALQYHFQDEILKPLHAFIYNRPVIEHVAERLINNRRFEADGCSVLIRTADC